MRVDCDVDPRSVTARVGLRDPVTKKRVDLWVVAYDTETRLATVVTRDSQERVTQLLDAEMYDPKTDETHTEESIQRLRAASVLLTDREFLYALLADLRTLRDRGRVTDEDVSALVVRVREHVEKTSR